MLIFLFCATTIPKQCKVVTWSGRLTNTDSTLDTSRLVHSAPQSISKHTWYLVSIMCRSVSIICRYFCFVQLLLYHMWLSGPVDYNFSFVFDLRFENWMIDECFVIILNFWYMVRTTQHTKMLTSYGNNGHTVCTVPDFQCWSNDCNVTCISL